MGLKTCVLVQRDYRNEKELKLASISFHVTKSFDLIFYRKFLRSSQWICLELYFISSLK